MTRIVEVNLFDLFDIVSAAEDYGYNDDVLMCSLFQWAQPTETELHDFAMSCVDADGYTQEDYEKQYQPLKEWYDKHAK